MEHLTLTETEFFRLISNPDSRAGLRTAYDEFTQRVIQLCLTPPGSGHPVHALSYAETELQYHEALQGKSHESELNLHVHKALAFVRKMLRFLAREYHPLPPFSVYQPVRRPVRLLPKRPRYAGRAAYPIWWNCCTGLIP